MVPRENKNNAYEKFGGPNKEYCGIFRSGLAKVIDRTRARRLGRTALRKIDHAYPRGIGQ